LGLPHAPLRCTSRWWVNHEDKQFRGKKYRGSWWWKKGGALHVAYAVGGKSKKEGGFFLLQVPENCFSGADAKRGERQGRWTVLDKNRKGILFDKSCLYAKKRRKKHDTGCAIRYSVAAAPARERVRLTRRKRRGRPRRGRCQKACSRLNEQIGRGRESYLSGGTLQLSSGF